MQNDRGLTLIHKLFQAVICFFNHIHGDGCLFGYWIAAACFVRRAGLRILFFGGIIHCIGFLLVIAFLEPRGAGRFCEAVKSFRGGAVRREPGMRRLAGLEFVVVHLHDQPCHCGNEQTTGTASNQAACTNGQGSK
nr:MAG TPA: hypothetical protein [Bacteriophage sp.]